MSEMFIEVPIEILKKIREHLSNYHDTVLCKPHRWSASDEEKKAQNYDKESVRKILTFIQIKTDKVSESWVDWIVGKK